MNAANENNDAKKSGENEVTDASSTISAGRLKSLIERVERLEEEKATVSNDIKEVFAEAKSAGFDVPTMKIVIKLRKKDPATRDEQEYLLDTYINAVGL
jgi:uncharacterized protein (UPF0335 family)